MQVIVDDLLTNYETTGHGKVIVLVHGWGDRGAGLGSLGQTLATHYRVVIPDLPGFGGTNAPKEPWGLDEYAHFLKSFLTKLDVAEVYAFIGHSNGGAILIRGLASHTFAAERLVLIASAGIRGEYKGRTRVLRYLAKAGKAATTVLPASMREQLRKKAYKTIGSDMLVAEHLQETFKRVIGDDVRSDATALTMPTLLIYGGQDDATPARYGTLFQDRIKGSKLQIIAGAGHFVHLDQPEQTAQYIKEFLQ